MRKSKDPVALPFRNCGDRLCWNFDAFAFGGELELVGSFVYLTISILDGFLFWKIKLLPLNWNYGFRKFNIGDR